MVRSYTFALVFIFLSLLGDIPADVFFFYILSAAIRDAAIRDTNLEWLSWIISLLLVELIFSWIPLLQGGKSGKLKS